MNRKNRIGFLVTSMVFLGAVWGLWRYAEFRGEERRLNHERCAHAVNVMVTEFLRTNKEAQKAHAGKGDFVRVAGSGYATPGPWNLQGRFYLSLDRVAVFERGTEQLQIMVFKGKEKSVSKPHEENWMICVTNPELWED
jgi:hypothetical protein